ncbi:Xylose operon regulatory protein [Planctomycetes bacterium CA13]|uniref:Xylose operon regulatory protein n=1 Tax=Novipirellula herctigrandis TaxID=2527986 RepID=A0A5C5Z3R6_9BACT|nr:Xylose operon regulatory protein [Planctomycetes bacterium CA13]
MDPPKQILLLVETSRVFGRGIIQGISRYAKERANWLFSFEDRGLLEELPPWLKNWQGDGVIVRSPTRNYATAISQMKCPVVELLGDGKQRSAEVRVDERMTAEMAVNHLVQQGFEHLAFYSFAGSWWSDARRDAFESITKSRGLSSCIFPGAFEGDDSAYPPWKQAYEESLVRWLDHLPKPVGIWAVADSQAIRVLEACRKLKLHVPADVGILGTSNEDIVCSMLSPSLSSVGLNAQEVGYKAASLLNAKMKRSGKPKASRKQIDEPVMITPSGVVIRKSTDRIAVIDPELDQAVKLIEQQALNGLTVEALANELMVSRSTLERRFRAFFKCSPAQEIDRIRIERSKALLRDTAWPISIVGQKTGFGSPENFVRFFRRIVGKTPRQYRNGFYED